MAQQHGLLVNPPLVVKFRPPNEFDPWQQILEAVVKGDGNAARSVVTEVKFAVAEAEGKAAIARKTAMEYERRLKALDAMADWMAKGPSRLERPSGSSWPSLASYPLDPKLSLAADTAHEELREIISGAPQVFVVEHDWSGVFDGVSDFLDGEYALPFDHCCFEFQITGRRVLAVTKSTDGDTYRGAFFFQIGGDWINGAPGSFGEAPDETKDPTGELAPMYQLIFKSIKALCIALEAEVAVSEVIRVPGHSRRRNTPIAESIYRVVRLSNRRRTAPPALSGEQARKRLHFRRGHWRHYDAHKTWIRWMLVGDPDLGFIDKHYRA